MQFEPDVAAQLIEFAKYIGTIDADFLIFMARKSLCLYDVLVRMGIPPTEKCVLSDRILDMDLQRFENRRVALIDDTLILGTTLGKTKQLLLRAGAASVTVHVFCIDDDYWSRDLVDPEKCMLHLDDSRVMTFCAAAVRALSLMPRPYLVDFPISRPIKIRADEAQCFLSNRAWRGFNISTSLQERNDVSSLSFFPNSFAKVELDRRWGTALSPLLDIIKVRGFARKNRDVYWLQLVPIVVLRPLHIADLEPLFIDIINRVPNTAPDELLDLTNQATTPRAKQRLVQYVLSCIVGHAFLSESATSISTDITLEYDQQEAERHYGPWLGTQLRTIASTRSLAHPLDTEHYRTTEIPAEVAVWSKETIDSGTKIQDEPEERADQTEIHEIRNLIPAFTDLFVRHYDVREIPAREDAKKRGAAILDAIEAGGRDRLESGLPWAAIVDHMLAVHRLKRSPAIEDALSLVLDFCNDQGIAVPVTWTVNEVVFRAYRHGEDVKYTDAEPALAFHLLKGYLDTTHLDAIPRLRLEKLLVTLMKVGIARGFMEPLFLTAAGVQGVLRIGFYLHGAIPMLQRGPRDRADRDMWFSDHLQIKGVLKKTPTGQYQLGREVDGNFRISSAPDDAYELGAIIGRLSKTGNNSGPLDDRALTLLTSCGTPRHAAAAVQVELDIFRRWYEDQGSNLLASMDWSNAQSMSDAAARLVTAKGHYAIHEARLKYVGYTTGEPRRIIDDCSTYLASQGEELIRRKWNAYWNATRILEASGEKDIFDPELATAIMFCWEMTACLSAIEICLLARVAELTGAPEAQEAVRNACQKLNRYSTALASVGLEAPRIVKQLTERFKRVEEQPNATWDTAAGLQFARSTIEQRLPAIIRHVEAMNPLIEEYGRLYGRRDYQYMVYYDIIDSTATKAGAAGANVPAYRARVHTVKAVLSRNFDQLAQVARKRASEVFCWNGAASSTNDCKHIFIGGTDAFGLLEETVDLLMTSLKSSPGQRFRIYVVPCGFAGSNAYRTEWDTEVSGERFWEHWSRLSKTGKEFENTVPQTDSFLLVATEELIGRLTIPADIQWSTTTQTIVRTEIELLSRETIVKWGTLTKRAGPGPSTTRSRTGALNT